MGSTAAASFRNMCFRLASGDEHALCQGHSRSLRSSFPKLLTQEGCVSNFRGLPGEQEAFNFTYNRATLSTKLTLEPW